jgi:tetratricopeptide (TPR) repeat protein
MNRPAQTVARRRIPRILASSLALLGITALAGLVLVVISARARARTAAEIQGRLNIARDSLKAGEPGRALRAIARIPESGPWEAEVLSIKGMALAAYNRPDDARPLLERSLAIDPKQTMVAKVLAAVYFNDDELDRGFEMLARSASLDPSDFRPWYASGEMMMRRRNRPRQAVDLYRQALRRLPSDQGSRAGLAGALLALGEIDEAGPLVDSLLGELPDDPRVLYLAATRSRLLSRPDEVERFAGQSLLGDPDNVDALLLRARARLESGRASESLGDVERAATLAPDNLTALDLLTRVESAVGLKERAAATSSRHRAALALVTVINRLEQEARERPKDTEAHWRLGQAAAKGGRTALARKSFRAALALDSSCKPAHEGLAALDGIANSL